MKYLIILFVLLFCSCNNYIDVADIRVLAEEKTMLEIRGLVSGVVQDKGQLGGFYIQDARYFYKKSVFVNSLAKVSVGDEVLLNAIIIEKNNETQLDNVELLKILSHNRFINVEQISLPISDEQWEELEGCLVEINDNLQISDSYQFNKYGQLLLSNGELIQETELFDAQDDSLEIIELTFQQELNSIYIDDLSDLKFPKIDSLYIDPFKVVVGAKCSKIKGFVSQYNKTYKVRLVNDLTVEQSVPPNLIDLDTDLKIMNFNLYNLFNGNGKKEGFPTSRGAKSYDTYQLQLKKLASAIYAVDPDILAMMELENDGEDEFSSIQQFCDYLNKHGDRQYEIAHTHGVIGDYPIKTGIIYDPSVVETKYKAQYHNHPNFSRPSLSQRFMYNDSLEFVLCANHFKSKGSRNAKGLDLDQKDGQASYNYKRTLQAKTLLDIIDSLYFDENIIVLGDFNAYSQEDPIKALQSTNLNRLETVNHSYVYKGKNGSLDHIFVSDNFKDHIDQVQTWNINSIYPSWINYSYNLADSSYFRSSDHNPMILGFNGYMK
ncbi:MAG: ExeM/NucH family extracellular endonuclease [Flavobacteriales bacterium]